MSDVTFRKAPGLPPQVSAAAPPAPAQAAAEVITDAKGRKLKLRELTLLEEQDLIVAMGVEHSGNNLVLGRALAAARVAEIDGLPVMLPHGHLEYRAMLQRVGKDGLVAVLATMVQPNDGDADELELAKN